MKGGLLTHLLIAKEMSVEEIYANVTEMLLAGVDTVCVSVCVSVCAYAGLYASVKGIVHLKLKFHPFTMKMWRPW